MKLAFIDTETSGLKVETDYVIEIGISVYQHENSIFTPIESFESLVKPPVVLKLDPKVSAINGITDEDLDGALLYDDVRYIFDVILKGCDYLIGHNIQFDYNFLMKSFEAIFNRFKSYQLDTLRIWRKLQPERKSHKLTDLYTALYTALPEGEAHSALYDAELCAGLFQLAVKECGSFDALLEKHSEPLILTRWPLGSFKGEPIDLKNVKQRSRAKWYMEQEWFKKSYSDLFFTLKQKGL